MLHCAFFCKAGMVDVALELYNLRSEFGLSPNSMAYKYLINTLCGDGSVDEAYRVLKNSIEQGYFPCGRTFSILADALCREGKLDKMKELVIVALERNFMPTTFSYDKFISALCRARRVEIGYLIHGELERINKVTKKTTYFNLIHGFNKLNRGDIALLQPDFLLRCKQRVTPQLVPCSELLFVVYVIWNTQKTKFSNCWRCSYLVMNPIFIFTTSSLMELGMPKNLTWLEKYLR